MGFELRDISQALKSLPKPLERAADGVKSLTSAIRDLVKAVEEMNRLERNRQSIEYVQPPTRPVAVPDKPSQVLIFSSEDSEGHQER